MPAGPPAKRYGSGTGPVLLPGLPRPRIDRRCPGVGWPAPGPTALCHKQEDSRGQTCHSPTTVPQAFPGRPWLLLPYLSASPSSTSTQRASHERRALFPRSRRVPKAARLTERYLHHCIKARFLPFAPHAAVRTPCCCTKQPSLRAERAVSNQPACQELS